MKLLEKLYEKLNMYYVVDNWWPADSFIEMAIGAILVQNTQWTQVEKSLQLLKPFMNATTITNLSLEELKIYIAASGYATRKAATIVAFIAWYKSYDFDLDTIKALDSNKVRTELLAIHGIGEETADSILLYGLSKPYFIVDTYLKRIFRRVGLPSFKIYKDYQTYIHEILPLNTELFKQFHALIVIYGKDLATQYKQLTPSDPLYSLRQNYIQYHENHLKYLRQKDPIMKKLISSYGWVNRAALANPYHAIIYAITGQLVSAKMALILYQRFFDKFPSIEDAKDATIDEIKAIGLTYKRATYIYDIIQLILSNKLDLDAINTLSVTEVITILSNLTGIGIWSAKIILMHGYQNLNVTTNEDLGLRKALFALYDIPQTKKAYNDTMEKFHPYKTVASIYLWEHYHHMTKK